MKMLHHFLPESSLWSRCKNAWQRVHSRGMPIAYSESEYSEDEGLEYPPTDTAFYCIMLKDGTCRSGFYPISGVESESLEPEKADQ